MQPDPPTPEVSHQAAESLAVEGSPALAVGTLVRLRQRPAYLKTADPMPMLRPPDLIGVDEPGQVVEVRALGQLAVRFRRGTFLLAADLCTPAAD